MVHITEYPCFHEQQYYAPSTLGAPVLRHTRRSRRRRDLLRPPLSGIHARAGARRRRSRASCRRPASSTNGRRGSSKARCARRRSRTATSSRSAIAWVRKSAWTFAGESFVCGPEGAVRARAPKGADGMLLADINLADAGQLARAARAAEGSPAGPLRATGWERRSEAEVSFTEARRQASV